jgi:hypothetical protein
MQSCTSQRRQQIARKTGLTVEYVPDVKGEGFPKIEVEVMRSYGLSAGAW